MKCRKVAYLIIQEEKVSLLFFFGGILAYCRAALLLEEWLICEGVVPTAWVGRFAWRLS